MKKYLTIIISLLIFSGSAWSQKEMFNWTMGVGAGWTWNTVQTLTGTGMFGNPNISLTGLPTPSSGSTFLFHGTLTASDRNGNLLFYSSGVNRLNNANHTLMLNGDIKLQDNLNQQGIVMPYPGSSTKYIIVTTGYKYSQELYYSVIDMTLDGGLGAVVPGQKDIPITGLQGEFFGNITAYQHPNGIDFWLVTITRDWINSPTCNAWLFTSTGPTATPIISNIPYGAANSGNGGYLRISHNGKHFLWTTDTNLLVYGDFNVFSGRCNNVKADDLGTNKNTLGCEFSPNLENVFIFYWDNGTSCIMVYNAQELFMEPTTATVTKKNYCDLDWSSGYMQLGPDLRIYFTSGSAFLYLIADPDNYTNPQFYKLDHTKISSIQFYAHLPNFAASWLNTKINIDRIICAGNESTFSTEVSGGGISPPVSIEWDFGDGTTITEPYISGVTTYTQNHTYNTSGRQVLTITPYDILGVPIKTEGLVLEIAECPIQTNKMIRTNLLNAAQQKK